MRDLRKLKVVVLDLDDAGLNSLIESLSAQIDSDVDSDLPLDFDERGNKLKYSKLVIDLINDPFSIELFLENGLSKTEVWIKTQVIHTLLEYWLAEIGYGGGANTLLDVKIVDYKLYIMGVNDVRKELQVNRMGERYTRYNRTSQNKRAIRL